MQSVMTLVTVILLIMLNYYNNSAFKIMYKI